jgi:filamentous hemagglutinin family protein
LTLPKTIASLSTSRAAGQPGSRAALLARVTGADGSILAGSLSANGQFALVNPNGIAITNTGIVNTAGFIASTLDIADADFLSGKLTFRRSGKAAAITNQGQIFGSQGVALIGSGIINEGLVSARLGKIGYAAGDLVSVDFSGDNFLSVLLPVSEIEGLSDAFGRPLSALITLDGTSRADGGSIYISAAVARGLMRNAVHVRGDLIANTIGQDDQGRIRLGNIVIDGKDGAVDIAGRMDVSGAAGLAGGQLTVLGADLSLEGAINVTNGGLTLSAGSSNDITATAALSVGRFELTSGNWKQTATTLPGFSATDFILTGGTFLRAAGGAGTVANPYKLTDVFGLQGMGSSDAYRAANYQLANNIDASGTSGWNGSAGFVPVGTDSAQFTGSLDGGGYTINGLTINRPATNLVGLFGWLGTGSSVSNLGLVGGAVTGANSVGALVGISEGTLWRGHALANLCHGHSSGHRECRRAGRAGLGQCFQVLCDGRRDGHSQLCRRADRVWV